MDCPKTTPPARLMAIAASDLPDKHDFQQWRVARGEWEGEGRGDVGAS